MDLKEISTDELMTATQQAVAKFDRDSVAFLSATGKIELFFRNLLARELIEKLDSNLNQNVIREWRRHDLALLEGETPFLLLESKAWIHFDAINEKKLIDQNGEIREAFDIDVKKLRETKQNFANCNTAIFMILSSVDVSKSSDKNLNLIAYHDSHRKGIKQTGSFENLTDEGRSKLTGFLEGQSHVSNIKRAPLFEGKFEGAEIYVEGYFALIN